MATNAEEDDSTREEEIEEESEEELESMGDATWRALGGSFLASAGLTVRHPLCFIFCGTGNSVTLGEAVCEHSVSSGVFNPYI